MSTPSDIGSSGFPLASTSTSLSNKQMLEAIFLAAMKLLNQGDTTIKVMGIKYDFYALIQQKINALTDDQAADLLLVLAGQYAPKS